MRGASPENKMCPITVRWKAKCSPQETGLFLGSLDLLIKQEVGNGDWYKFDEIGIAATANQANALVGIKAYTAAIAVNSPTFTANNGFNGNGTTSYVNTGFNWAGAVNFTLNAGMFGFYNLSTSTSGIGDMGWHSGPSTNIILTTSGNFQYQYGNNGALVATTPASIVSMWNGYRTSSVLANLYLRTVSQGSYSTATSGTSLGNAFICCESNNTTPTNFCSRQYAAWWFGAGTISLANWYNNFQAFATTNGFNK